MCKIERALNVAGPLMNNARPLLSTSSSQSSLNARKEWFWGKDIYVFSYNYGNSMFFSEITAIGDTPIFYWTITKGRVEMNRFSLVTFCTVLNEKSWALKCDGWQNPVVPSSWNGKTTARQPIFNWIGRDILSKISINSHSCEARMRLAPFQKNSRQPQPSSLQTSFAVFTMNFCRNSQTEALRSYCRNCQPKLHYSLFFGTNLWKLACM